MSRQLECRPTHPTIYDLATRLELPSDFNLQVYLIKPQSDGTYPYLGGKPLDAVPFGSSNFYPFQVKLSDHSRCLILPTEAYKQPGVGSLFPLHKKDQPITYAGNLDHLITHLNDLGVNKIILGLAPRNGTIHAYTPPTRPSTSKRSPRSLKHWD